MPRRIACRSSGSSGNIAAQGTGPRIDAVLIHASAARLDNPARHGRDEEVADDTDDEKNAIDRIASVRDEVGVAQLFDVLREHQGLQTREHGPEQVAHRQPERDAHITGYPCRQRGLESVIYGDGESQGPQQREDDEEERAQGIHREAGRLKEQLQQAAEPSSDRFSDVVRRSFGVHPGHDRQVAGTSSQLIELTVELFVADQIGRFRIAEHRLALKLVLLLLEAMHIECFVFHERGRRAVHRPKYSVDGAQHQRRKEHDAQAQHEGPQQRKDVDGLGAGQRLPHAVTYVEHGSDARDAFGHDSHTAALYEHVALQVAKELVQIVPVYIQRHYHKRMRIERLIIAFLLRTVQGCHPR